MRRTANERERERLKMTRKKKSCSEVYLLEFREKNHSNKEDRDNNSKDNDLVLN